MSVIYHERPGVYSDYDCSRVSVTEANRKTVGIVAQAELAAGVYTVRDAAGAKTLLGEESALYRLTLLCLRNGAQTVLACPAGTDYAAAIARVLTEKQAAYLVVDSEDETVQKALAQALCNAARQNNECIGLVTLTQSDPDALLARAKAINCERVALLAPGTTQGREETAQPADAAACFAGQLAAQSDPAMPLHSMTLLGLSGVLGRYEEDTIDRLIRGGVCVLEAQGGAVCLLRGVTTRTQTEGEEDATFRELNTTLVADEVIPAIRRALRLQFSRAKNNYTTRNAIRNQVILELESRVEREIIGGYGEVSAEASTIDPTVCEVEFGFSALSGLSRIYLTAHVSV